MFHKVCILFVGIMVIPAVLLIWTGFDNIFAWKSLGTIAVLLCGFLISAVLGSGWRLTDRGLTGSATQAGATGDAAQNDGGGPYETYILDKGLIRFVKFAASILTIFVVVGVCLYGIDLKNAAEQIQSVRADMNNTKFAVKEAELQMLTTKANFTELMKQAQKEIANAHTAALKTKGEIEKQSSTTRILVAQIQGRKTQVDALFEFGDSPSAWLGIQPAQVEHLVEVKLLKSMRSVLPPEDFAKLEKTLIPDAGTTLRRMIYDAERGESLPGKLVRSEGQPATNDPAVNEVYDNIGTFHEFLHAVFERNSLDDHGMPIAASVHYGSSYNNGFWDGSQLALGDGDGIIFRSGGFNSLSVMAHELSLGVIGYAVRLQFDGQSGAITTHLADVFGTLTEQWKKKQTVAQASWLIGEGCLAPDVQGKALRSMRLPGTAYDDPKLGKDPQPSDMAHFVTTSDGNGGAHINAGILNRAFYEVAAKIGGNAWEAPGKIWYKSMPKLSALATFDDFSRITHKVAGELYGEGSAEQEAVAHGWQTVGIAVKP